ncbi:hypothetical protein AXF42_Ash014839 [Apostasia shenzhenica]|uniref:Sec1 family domain-containing protein MIP3 n=1 Tax=Apostasia shenzhenica TaxID=1088818 RepID=A0A2I0ALK3_9ASPA|nr:hypothetical protein AXF42_Ash014839 [Apostasia shenzhenica]
MLIAIFCVAYPPIRLSFAVIYIQPSQSQFLSGTKSLIIATRFQIAHSANADSPLGPDAFREYESLLLQDYEEIMMMNKKEDKLSNQYTVQKRASDVDFEEFPMEDDGWSGLTSRENSDPTYSCSGERAFYDESKFTEVDTSARLQVTVHHYPMILCAVSPRVFFFPSDGAVAEARLSNNNSEDSLSPGLPPICTGLASDGEDVPSGATLTAHFLYSLAAKLDLKMEIYSLGDTSKVIGKMLTDMSSLYDVGRRNRRSAGLLLLDRTLDILTPCCHGDSFLDRMISSLSRRGKGASCLAMKSSHSVNKTPPSKVRHAPLDVKIPFSRILSHEESNITRSKLSDNMKAFISGWDSAVVGSESIDIPDYADKHQDNILDDESYFLSGSFLTNYTGANYLEALVDRRAKDGILLIKKWLMEGLQREKVPLKGLLGFATTSELYAMVKRLVSDQTTLIRNRGIIQLALAAETVMSEPHSSRWDAFVSAERILNVSLLDNSQSLARQICDLVNSSTLVKSHGDHMNIESVNGLLSFQDALLLSMVGYIFAGEHFQLSGSSGLFSWEEEHSLKETIIDAILKNPTKENLHFLHGLEKDLEANAGNEVQYTKNDDFDDQWGSWDDEDTDRQNDQTYGDMQLKLELRDRVEQLFKLFYKLSGLKQKTTFLSGLVTSPTSFSSDPYTRKGLLYKLLGTVLAKYDIPEIEYHSSAVGRFFKGGFGRFGLGQAKPNLGDQNVLLVFVVGGINSLEVWISISLVLSDIIYLLSS